MNLPMIELAKATDFNVRCEFGILTSSFEFFCFSFSGNVNLPNKVLERFPSGLNKN